MAKMLNLCHHMAPDLIQVPPLTYGSHREWAVKQPGSRSIDCIFSVHLNEMFHRCRIGKITLKQASQ